MSKPDDEEDPVPHNDSEPKPPKESEQPAESDDTEPSKPALPVQFPDTSLTMWERILGDMKNGNDEQALKALHELVLRYRPAFLAFFKLKVPHHQNAEDLASAFVEHLLTKNRFQNFERRAGVRFRHYLVAGMLNFLRGHLPDTLPPEPPAGEGGESKPPAPLLEELNRSLDREIARALHERCLRHVRRRWESKSMLRRFEVLQAFIVLDGIDYPQTANDLGMTENAVRQECFRLRDSYIVQFRDEVLPTIRNQPEELEAEMRYLLGLVREMLEGERGPGTNPPSTETL